MAKVRVPVLGTIGKSVRVNPDATDGATLGLNLFGKDGELLTLEALAALIGLTTEELNDFVFEDNIVDGTILARIADNENITGAWDFDGLTSDYVQFDILYADGTAEGKLQWNAEDGTLEVGMPGGNVNLQIGQEQMVRCRNTTGSQIDNGNLVYVAGASGNKPLLELAAADSEATAHVLGFATEDIAHNDNGYVTIAGLVRDVDTSGMAAGDTVFLSSTPGEFINTVPTPPVHGIDVGEVIAVHATEGVVLAHIGVDIRIEHASDVILDSLTDREVLVWDAASGTWINDTLVGVATVTTTSHTAAAANPIILVDDDAAGAPVTIALPPAATAKTTYHVKKLGTTSSVIVDGDGTETIDGALTATLTTRYESIMLVSDGSNWHVI